MSEKAIKSFSVFYVQEEDRLLFETIFEDEVRTFWITRRAAFKLIELFNAQIYGGTTPSAGGSSKNEKLGSQPSPHFERDIAATRNPPKPGKIQTDIQSAAKGGLAIGVLKTIKLSVLDEDRQKFGIFLFDLNEKGWGFNTDRATLMSLQSLIMQKMEVAEWGN